MIVLCGQEQLAARIERFPEIKSRMYPSALSALSREETEDLIRYRWQVASVKQGQSPTLRQERPGRDLRIRQRTAARGMQGL